MLHVMDRPASAPNAENLSAWAALALAYLREQLGERAPDVLGVGRIFDANPLEGEGPVAVFPFDLQHIGEGDRGHFVVIGRTEPNYYPAYGLDAEDIFHLHLGTRFMLVMQVAQRSPQPEDDFDPQREARAIVDRVAPQAKIEELSVAACFDVEGQLHAVLKCRIDGTDAYLMAGEAPRGFSTDVCLPPQVAYRIHLGRVLLAEPKPADES